MILDLRWRQRAREVAARLQGMATRRSDMTARVVPLRSRAAAESRVGSTAPERLALVIALSEASWSHTGRPRPRYTRATMPIVVSSLSLGHDPA